MSSISNAQCTPALDRAARTRPDRDPVVSRHFDEVARSDLGSERERLRIAIDRDHRGRSAGGQDLQRQWTTTWPGPGSGSATSRKSATFPKPTSCSARTMSPLRAVALTPHPVAASASG
jgi:hypothetical protein